ncbi:MAG: ABC transporter ATP-binding protein/permease [Kiritimatiellaeota bacterium]|nr:ABC transporter ATP-binding protein/permease [Kiritimatiellota bacterium]
MFSLLKLLRPHWHWVLLAPLAMALECAMDLKLPQIMGLIIDDGIKNGSQAAVAMYGGKMMLCAVLGLLGGFGCMVFSSRAALNFGNDLRVKLFKHILTLSDAETRGFTAGSLITRVTNDVGTMQFVVVMITRMLIRSPMLLVGSVILVLRTDSKIALPLLVAAPLLAWIVTSRVKKMRPQYEIVQQRTDAVNDVMRENLAGVRVVKAFAKEEDEQARFGGANEALTDANIRSGRIMSVMGPMLSIVQHATIVAILLLASDRISIGALKIGQLSAIIQYATQLMFSLIMLSMWAMHISRAMVSARRIREVLDSAPSVVEGTRPHPPPDGSVEFRNVTFRYPGASGEPSLRDITITIPSGANVAIMGGTGSGKSTLANLIPRFHDPTDGAVFIGGINVRDYTFAALRGAIGIVPQDTSLFADTIAANIRWGYSEATDDEIKAATAAAAAHNFIMDCPDAYNASVAQGGVTLSGGQKQRVCIARALIRKPKILILDDATSAVDITTESEINAALRAFAPNMTVIRIAQRISSVRESDTIFLLDNGRLIASGNHATLLSTSPEYREICDSQNAR